MEQNKITEVTRQEIIDLIIMGFTDSGTFEDVRIFWSGRLDETAFLSRIYNLTEMHSTDGRFSNAEGDIWQHRINNYDWEDDWVFYDGRFKVKIGSDINFLRFITEMFHPAVRDEKRNWKRLLELINELLRIDGFELYEESHISGRSKYAWREVWNKNKVGEVQSSSLATKFNSEYINLQIKVMNDSIDTNPADAIGKAKELFENCCKTVLMELNVPIDEGWNVMRLTKEACNALKLTPDHISETAKASDTIKRLLGNFSAISHSMAELRNSYGSGHGKDAKFKGLAPRHARLAVGGAVAAVLFIWETYEEQKGEHGNG